MASAKTLKLKNISPHLDSLFGILASLQRINEKKTQACKKLAQFICREILPVRRKKINERHSFQIILNKTKPDRDYLFELQRFFLVKVCAIFNVNAI